MKLIVLLHAIALAGLLATADAQSDTKGSRATKGGASHKDADLEKRLAQIDAMVADRMAGLNVPGYCLAVIKSGNVVFQKPYGVANLETKQPATNDTVFGLASLTKTFTALTLLSLVDKGLVGLDDPLSKYVDGLTKPYQTLTIRQLASMTGGVPSKLSPEVSWQDQLPILGQAPLESKPGSAFLYSNFSYRLLGSVIAKATGRPFLEVVNQTIIDPLQMKSTATTVLLQSTARVAQGYGDAMGKGRVHPVEYKDPAISFSAGMLASTSNDLVKYAQGLLTRKVISAQGYKTMWYDRPALSTGEPSPWAFGWSSGRNKIIGGQFSVAMNGGTPGVASTIILLPESNSAVIALCNLRKPAVYDIARTAARMAFGNPNDAPVKEDQPVGIGQ
jgi:CubicO group peptidase (beta-lactamase class C family)